MYRALLLYEPYLGHMNQNIHLIVIFFSVTLDFPGFLDLMVHGIMLRCCL